MIAIQASERNGPLVGATQLFAGDEIMLISDQGTMVRTRGDEVSVVGRNTQGVRIIRLKDSENLVRLARIAEPEEEEFVAEDAADNNAAEGSASNEEAAEGSSDDSSADE
jgi:DNA gyrase subunit A